MDWTWPPLRPVGSGAGKSAPTGGAAGGAGGAGGGLSAAAAAAASASRITRRLASPSSSLRGPAVDDRLRPVAQQVWHPAEAAAAA